MQENACSNSGKLDSGDHAESRHGVPVGFDDLPLRFDPHRVATEPGHAGKTCGSGVKPSTVGTGCAALDF